MWLMRWCSASVCVLIVAMAPPLLAAAALLRLVPSPNGDAVTFRARAGDIDRRARGHVPARVALRSFVLDQVRGWP